MRLCVLEPRLKLNLATFGMFLRAATGTAPTQAPLPPLIPSLPPSFPPPSQVPTSSISALGLPARPLGTAQHYQSLTGLDTSGPSPRRTAPAMSLQAALAIVLVCPERDRNTEWWSQRSWEVDQPTYDVRNRRAPHLATVTQRDTEAQRG